VNNPRGYSLQNIIVARSCRLHDETVNAHLFTHLHLSFDLVLVLFIALKLSFSIANTEYHRNLPTKHLFTRSARHARQTN